MAAGGGENVSPLILGDTEGCVEEFVERGEKLVSDAIQMTLAVREAIQSLKKITVADFAKKFP